MVTIEQKLTLFSKLLNQGIKEEMDEKFTQLENEFEKRIAENKFKTDKEANEIIEQSRKRAEIKKVELISKGKLSSKKEVMQAKQEMISRFMRALDEKVLAYTSTNEYLDYLKQTINHLEPSDFGEGSLVIYLTQNDHDCNQPFIKELLLKKGINESDLCFEITKENMLGGLIVACPECSTRVNLSIRSSIEDYKEQIVEKISRAIGEVGTEEDE